jgi:hypothetical protein
MNTPTAMPSRWCSAAQVGARRQPGRPRSFGAPARILIAPPSPISALQRPGGMRRNPRGATLGVAAQPSPATNPRIEITPSVAQYRQLCRDLGKLRKLGAPTNTAAILDAVHVAAQGHKLGSER